MSVSGVSIVRPLMISASRDPLLEQTFSNDAHWAGGDGASAFDLANGSRVWLFGDSFVNPRLSPLEERRRDAHMIRNSVGVQSSESSPISFMWNSDENGTPQDAITCPYPNEWYWPLGGVHVDGVAYIFVCRVTGGAANAFGFDVRGWDLLSVETDTGEFCTAHTTRIRLPATATTAVSLGGGGVWRDRDYIYAMGVSSQGDAIHARLPVESLRTGFALIEWLVGDGWSFADREPVVMLHRSHAEFSVSNLGAYGWLWVQQAPRIFDSRIVARWAEDIRGPWSPFITLHTPDEPLSTMGTPSFAYGARAHLTADSLLATYCVNGLEAANIEADLSVYFPRVVRLDLYDDAVGPPLTSLRDMFANNSE